MYFIQYISHLVVFGTHPCTQDKMIITSLLHYECKLVNYEPCVLCSKGCVTIVDVLPIQTTLPYLTRLHSYYETTFIGKHKPALLGAK